MATIEEIKEPVVQESTPSTDGQQFDEEPATEVLKESSENEELPKFTPEEIRSLVESANNHKITGNEYFSKLKFEEAITEYERALDTCPDEIKNERAIYWGNIGACYVKMGKYEDAVEACTKALGDLPTYTKVLLRRAQANEKLHTLTSLTSALEDYKTLQSTPSHQSELDPSTRNSINSSIQRLPSIIAQQQEKEKNEMLGKLKDFGNTVLGKFGLSTDNFQMVKDPNSEGYSIQFVNNADKSGEKSS
ncbi:10715_t:CDS:2 [Acaulospora colombiana]|uniref:10715_t:CDS:1 n=1 Tax=Acaulospora colombiana TaxID=27376 RepID=A0ACA9L760_9GLOM|nr:10715_t:CDS:2 [Acaulospora colombiana]